MHVRTEQETNAAKHRSMRPVLPHILRSAPMQLELTDGWYWVRGQCDEGLSQLVRAGRIWSGTRRARVAARSTRRRRAVALSTDGVSRQPPPRQPLTLHTAPACLRCRLQAAHLRRRAAGLGAGRASGHHAFCAAAHACQLHAPCAQHSSPGPPAPPRHARAHVPGSGRRRATATHGGGGAQVRGAGLPRAGSTASPGGRPLSLSSR